MDYSGIALYVWVQFLAPMELSAYIPASCLVVPILIATHEINYGTCGASHVVDHDALESHQTNEVLPLQEDPFLYTKYLRKTVQGFWMFLIKYYT